MGQVGEPETGTMPYDFEAREAHVIGKGPRYAALSESDIPEDAQALVTEIKAAFGIPPEAPMPEVSLISLRHPGMFKGQMAMGIELAARGTIPPHERELAILRIALLCGAPFEWSEHVDIGRRFGVTDEEIERVRLGSSAQGWTDHQRAVLRGVEELIANKALSDATWDALAATWSEQQMMELPMLVGSYMMTALQQNTLRIPPRGGFDYRG